MALCRWHKLTANKQISQKDKFSHKPWLGTLSTMAKSKQNHPQHQ